MPVPTVATRTQRRRSALPLLLLLLLATLSLSFVSAQQLDTLQFTEIGALSPVFSPSTYAYSMKAIYTTTTVKFRASTPGAASVGWRLDPLPAETTLASGVESAAIAIVPGTNMLRIRSPAGSGTDYVISILRMSNDATLSNLACDVALNPVFLPATINYRVTLPYTTNTWSCTPTRAQGGAAIAHSRNEDPWLAVTSATSFTRAVSIGDNYVQIRVIAEDNAYSKVYMLVVHVLSHDSSLSDLVAGSSALSPAFAPATTSYQLTLGSAIGSITFQPSFTYLGTTAAPTVGPATTAFYSWRSAPDVAILTGGVTAPALTVLEGDNSFVLRVVAEDSTPTLYTVNVHRISADVRLGSLVMSPAQAFTPPFFLDTFDYDVSVNFAVTSVSFSFAPNYPLAKQYWTTNGGTYSAAWGASVTTGPVAVPVGDTTLQVQVIAEDKISSQTYVVKVHRLSNLPDLSSLITSTSLSPAFSAATLSYAMTVGVQTASFRLSAIPAYPLATLHTRLNGAATWDPLSAGVLSAAFVLATGANTIEVRVTPEDLTTPKVYAIAVCLQSAACTVQSLTTAPVGGSLVPVFSPATLSYTLVMAASAGSLTLTSVPAPLAAQQFQWSDDPWASLPNGAPSPSITLVYGDNLVRIRVLAEDGLSQKTYTLLVHRSWSDSKLSALSSTVALVPPFSPATLSYAMTVPSTVGVVSYTATTLNPLAVLTAAYQSAGFLPASSGVPSAPLALEPGDPVLLGDTTIRLRVDSEDAATNTIYTIVIHRTSAVSTLSALAPTPLGTGLAPVFATGILSVATTAMRSLTRTCRIWRSDASGEASGR